MLTLFLAACVGHQDHGTEGAKDTSSLFESSGERSLPDGFQVLPTRFVALNICLEVHLAGHPGTHYFVLDSGAPWGAIDSTLASSLGLEQQVYEPPRGAATPPDARPWVPSVEVEIGQEQLVLSNLAVFDLQSMSNALGLPMSGIVGHDYFNHRVVMIDYKNRRVAVAPSAGFSYTGEGVFLPVASSIYFYSLAFLGAQPNSLAGVNVVIDTGSSYALSLTSERAAQLGLNTSPGGTMLTLYGEYDYSVAELGLFCWGQLSFGPCDVRVDPPISTMEGTGADCQIGAGLLSQFTAIFDIARKRIILEPGRQILRPLRLGKHGFRVGTAGPPFDRFIVRNVAEGMPAHNAGLRNGDELRRIAGTSVSGLDIDRIQLLLEGLRQSATSFTVVVLRGGVMLEIAIQLPGEG